jgi:PEP-CTERM/exosortase A-associated glycosyltransferase
MTLRILHVLDHSLPLHSGYSFRTIEILRQQRARGWEPLALTSPRHGAISADEEVIDGWRFMRTPGRPSLLSALPTAGRYLDEMRATAARIEAVVHTMQPDILQPHSPVLNALPALWVGRRHRIPVVYEVRASWEDAAVDHGTTREGSVRYRASRAVETYAVRNADAVTTICEGLRSDLVARGVEAEKITVIPNAVDVKAFPFARSSDPALRAELGLESATIIGFAGSFYAYEGLDLLLDAAAALLPRQPDLRVLLVGGGPQEQSLRSQAERLRIGSRVIFTGRVPHEKVQRYYELIDVLAYPRHSIRLTEIVTPLKPLEAMAQGRVLVASDVGGHRELIRHGETGWLFEAGDSRALARTIETVLAQRDRWPAVALTGRRFVETERTWARSVDGYAQVYARLLHQPELAAPAAPVRRA